MSDQPCQQTSQRLREYSEPSIIVKSETFESDECNTRTGEPRRWIVCEGGVLKEVLKVEPTDWTSGTTTDSRENIDHTTQRDIERISRVNVTHINVEPTTTSACVKSLVHQYGHPNGHASNGSEKPDTFLRTTDSDNREIRTFTHSTLGESPTTSRLATPDGRMAKPVKSFNCATCGRSFKRSSNLKSHEKLHTGVKAFACAICGRPFAKFSNLKRHETIHSDVKPFFCSTCGKSFRRFLCLKRHRHIHTGLKPYTCPMCGQAFSDPSACYNHKWIHIHTAMKPYTCSTCGESFTTTYILKIHETIHTGMNRMKAHICITCEKTFTSSADLKAHEEIHTNVKSFVCTTCGKEFSRWVFLKLHELRHPGMKPYVGVQNNSLTFVPNLHRQTEHEHKSQCPVHL